MAERWDALLRLERVNSPLAHPDTLRHLIPESLREILGALEEASDPKLSLLAERAVRLPSCSCGNNPYLAYFLAGEQAVMEAVVWLQSELGRASEADIAQAVRVIRTQARAEIDTFCSVCTCRTKADRCRFATAAR